MTYKIVAYLRLSKEEYSNEKELKDLNRIVTMYLDYVDSKQKIIMQCL